MVAGWLNVAVAFVTNFLSMGFAFYSFGVVMDSISRDFSDGGRFGASTIPMFMGVGMALCAPLIGRLIPKISLRNFMAAGCILGAAGYLLCAIAVHLWQLCLIFGLVIAISAQMMGGVSAQALVVNWFEKKRPLALGISLLGLSASGLVMPHVATYFGESGGWRAIFEAFAIALLVACPLVWFFVVGKPEDVGLSVDGQAANQQAAPTKPAVYNLKEIYSDAVVWMVAIPVGLAFFGSTAILLHSFSFAKDLGLSDSGAAWFVTACASGAAVGKILFSWLAQYIGNKVAFATSLVAQLLAFITLANGSSESVYIIAVVVVGLGFGGIVPLVAAILADLYGSENFAVVMGAVFPLFTFFQGFGTPFAGYMHDQYGNYDLVFWLFAAMIVIAILLTFRIPGGYSKEQQASI